MKRLIFLLMLVSRIGFAQFDFSPPGGTLNPVIPSSGGYTDVTPDYLWLKFNDGSGSTATESSGNSRNCSLTGQTWSTGYITFSTGYAAASSVWGDFTTQNFSISSWVNCSSFSSENTIFQNETYNNSGWYFYIKSDGSINLRFNQSGANQVTQSAASAIGTGSWHMVSATRIGSACKIYLDGVDVTSSAPSMINPVATGANPFLACSGGYHNYITGSMDDTRIYSYGLTAAQVLQIYNFSSGTHGQ